LKRKIQRDPSPLNGLIFLTEVSRRDVSSG
jgi:hypothetical protein